MKFRFFSVPVHGGDPGATELNHFLGSHRILATERHLVPDGANSVWAVCVSYDDVLVHDRLPVPAQARGDKVDYKDVLTGPEFAVFARLRALRKEMADKEGVPAYALFNNDQLAQIVQRRVDTPAALRAIHGVGEARVERYGEAFLAPMRDAALPAPSVAA